MRKRRMLEISLGEWLRPRFRRIVDVSRLAPYIGGEVIVGDQLMGFLEELVESEHIKVRERAEGIEILFR